MTFPKFLKLLDRSKKKNLPSSNPKSIVSEKNGKREELENYASLSTKLVDMSEYLWELIRLINASWITMSFKETSSVSWSNLKQAIIRGLGQLTIFLMRNQKLRNSVLNSLQKKNTSDLMYNSIEQLASMLKLWKKMNKRLVRNNKKAN